MGAFAANHHGFRSSRHDVVVDAVILVVVMTDALIDFDHTIYHSYLTGKPTLYNKRAIKAI